MILTFYITVILILSYGIYKVCELLRRSTDYLGTNYTLGVKGAGLNAITSSLPELFTSFIFIFYLTGKMGYMGTVGVTAGSVIFNSLLIPGGIVIYLYTKRLVNRSSYIDIPRYPLIRDGVVLLVSEIVLISGILYGFMSWKNGVVFLMIYFIYMLILKKDSKACTHKVELNPILKRRAKINLIIFSALLMIFCWGLVMCVVGIGSELEIPLLYSSVIIASIVSSVPNIVLSYRDAKLGNHTDAITNSLGSSIFDICVAHGLPLLVYTLINGEFSLGVALIEGGNLLRCCVLGFTFLSLGILLYRNGLTKTSGYILLGSGFIFIALLLGGVIRG